MPKINVYLPEELAAAVRDAQVPVSAICQSALERAVREVSALRGSGEAPLQPAHGPFTRFTPRARAAVGHAQRQAKEHGHDDVGTEHLLLGVLDEGDNLAIKVLLALDVDPNDVRAELTGSLKARSERDVEQQPPFTRLAKKALESATKESVGLGHNYIGCEHLLLGLLCTENGLASQVLRRMGLELRTTRRAVVAALVGYLQVREQQSSQSSPAASTLDEILRRLDAIERRLAG
jgi:ATP-dependent Clp protease ATP-binding subunit ClpC